MSFARTPMLHPLLRMLVVVLMGIALPWQGLWAATMVHAPAAGHAPNPTLALHGMALDAPAAAPLHPPCHEAAAATGADQAADDGTDAPASGPHGQARCTHCAACGAMAAALPATVPALPSAGTVPAERIAFVPRDVPTPWLGTPERPPQRPAS